MGDVNVREFVVDQLRPLLPTRWSWSDHDRTVDVIDRPTALLKLQSIRRAPSNPQGSRVAEYVLTLIEPKTDAGAREDALDDNLIDLVNAIDTTPNLKWGTATRVVFGEPATNLAFDITLELVFTKE